MNLPETEAVLMPYYACRRDCLFDRSFNAAGKIDKVFNNGFDAEVSGERLFFTFNAASLHTLSFLVPEFVAKSINKGDQVVFEGGALKIGLFELSFSNEISVPEPVEKLNPGVLGENLKLLHSNLKLFGRNSIVLPLVSGCRTQMNFLNGVEALLLEEDLDFEAIKRFVGAGEGLTPAFDDFLSGMIFCDRFLSIKRLRVPDDFADSISAKTTFQAVQQIRAAIRGTLSLKFERLLKNMAEREIRSHEILPVLQYGHSSGTDILCGVWFYLSQKVKI